MEESVNTALLSTEFLLTEFNALQDRAISLEEIKANRLNFFLLVVGVVVAGLSSLYGKSSFSSLYMTSVFVSAFVIFLLGILTLKNSVDYSIAIVSFYRKAGRIRRWFVENDPGIDKYVAFEPTDDRPKMKLSATFLAWRGGEPVLVVINMVSASVLVGAGLSLFCRDVNPWMGMTLVAPIVWFLQNFYISRRLEKQESLGKIFFPSSNR